MSRILVTDAKSMLKSFDFSMEDMAFTFGVTLSWSELEENDKLGIVLQGQPSLPQIHQQLEYYTTFWSPQAK